MEPSPGDKVIRPPRRWGRWIGFSILGLIVLAIAGHAFWGWWQEKKLGDEVAALRAKGEPVLTEELANAPVADEDNAVILLRDAAELVDQKSKTWEEFDLLNLGLPLTEKEAAIVKAVVEENKSALQKLRAARGRKGFDWQLDPLRPILSDLPESREQKPLANTAARAMLLAHHQGNDREVVELARDLLAQSSALEQMPAGLIPHLIGIGISTMACDAIFEIVADLKVGNANGQVSSEDLKRLIDVLLDEKPLRDGQQLALRVERANQVRGALSLRSMVPMDAQKEKGASIMEYLGRPLLLKDGRLLLQDTSETIKDAQESTSWPDFRQRTRERAKQHMAMRQSLRHMYLAMMGGVLDKPVEHTFRAITARRLGAVALALRWYASEHDGKLPAKLEELVPRYLLAVPDDLMAAGKKLGYISDAQRPRAYGVGENGTDEGGSDAPRRKGFDGGRWTEEDLVVDLTRRARKKLD